MFEEFITIIDFLLSSKAAVAGISLIWVLIEVKNSREERKQHFLERQQWTERIERITDTLNNTVFLINQARIFHENQQQHHQSERTLNYRDIRPGHESNTES